MYQLRLWPDKAWGIYSHRPWSPKGYAINKLLSLIFITWDMHNQLCITKLIVIPLGSPACLDVWHSYCLLFYQEDWNGTCHFVCLIFNHDTAVPLYVCIFMYVCMYVCHGMCHYNYSLTQWWLSSPICITSCNVCIWGLYPQYMNKKGQDLIMYTPIMRRLLI